MSRAAILSEKRAHKRKFCRSGPIFPSVLLGDAEIPYSLSQSWRAIGQYRSILLLFLHVALRYVFFLFVCVGV